MLPPMPSYIKEVKQHPGELREFQQFIRDAGIKSYLEIGGKYGGSIWAVAQAMGGGRIVCVDLGHNGDALPRCIKELKKNYGFDTHLLVGDSRTENIVQHVRALGPFDCVLIDADHKEPAVRKDFENYGRMAKHCCFHDVGYKWTPQTKHFGIDVPKVWQEIKETYKQEADFREIKHDDGHNGFGILTWRVT